MARTNERGITDQQQALVDEYLVSGSASLAADKSGFKYSEDKDGYYVYFLTCPVKKDIFYVGKGKGKRVSRHAARAKNGSVDNSGKYKRLKECGFKPVELIAQSGMNEADAYALEKRFIDAIGYDRLTNIQKGQADEGSRIIERIDTWIEQKVPIKEWGERFAASYGRKPDKVESDIAAWYWDACKHLRQICADMNESKA